MNEPKRRGRPPKLIALPVLEQVAALVPGIRNVSPAVTPFMERAMEDPLAQMPDEDFERLRAQSYANRVWAGQHAGEPRKWRIERVKHALEAQGLPFEGVVLP